MLRCVARAAAVDRHGPYGLRCGRVAPAGAARFSRDSFLRPERQMVWQRRFRPFRQTLLPAASP